MTRSKKLMVICSMFFSFWCVSADTDKIIYEVLSGSGDNKINASNEEDLYHVDGAHDYRSFYNVITAIPNGELKFLELELAKVKFVKSLMPYCLDNYRKEETSIFERLSLLEQDLVRRENEIFLLLENSYEQKNRYNNNLPYSKRSLSTNRYLNGSLVTNIVLGNQEEELKKELDYEYIATQAPIVKEEYKAGGEVESTTPEFYENIWKYHTSVVINLTAFEEMRNGKVLHKSEKYWPELGAKKNHGDISVETVDVANAGNFEVFALKLDKKDTQPRIVYLLHYKKWPDDGQEPFKDDLIHLKDVLDACLRKAKADGKENGAVLVHCSAGLRRTGFFIAFDLCVNYILKHKKVLDLPKLIDSMQDCRWGLCGGMGFWKSLYRLINYYFDFISGDKSEN